jgi:hypothetical protein
MAAYERRRRRVRPPSDPAGTPPPAEHPPSAGDPAPDDTGPAESSVDTPAVTAGKAPTPATAMHANAPVSPAAVRPTSPGALGPAFPAEREGERGLRGLVGSGSSQVGVGAALRARDAARPTDEQLAEAEERLVIVRRNWVPREDLPRRQPG